LPERPLLKNDFHVSYSEENHARSISIDIINIWKLTALSSLPEAELALSGIPELLKAPPYGAVSPNPTTPVPNPIFPAAANVDGALFIPKPCLLVSS